MSHSQDKLPLTNARPEQTIGGAAQDKYIIEQLISGINTLKMVEVISVSIPEDELSPIGRCSIRPLVQQVDGNNNVYSRGEIKNVPYLRLQGGNNGLVLDPVKGDIGLAGFCDRDISMVKRTGKTAAPNTRRQYSLNDAVYMFSCMGDAPEQFIHFKNNEIHLKSKTKIILDAPEVEVTNNLNVGGGITAKGIIESLVDVVAKAISVIKFGNSYNSHKHKENGTGSDTDVPNNQV